MKQIPYLLTALFLGCGSFTETAPPFYGQTAERVPFDIVGVWDVFTYQTEERPSKAEPWEAKWVLKNKEPFTWVDANGQGEFFLCDADNGGQYLAWNKPGSDGTFWFSINEHSFGRLMLEGENRRLYMAIRTDGGQDAPPLEYR